MTTRVKVCGLTREDDVDACLALGVSFLGFNGWPRSPRYVASARLASLLATVAGRAETALVVVDAKPEEVQALLYALPRALPPPWIQLHGGQAPAAYATLGAGVIQVLRLGKNAAAPATPVAGRVLLDVHHPDFGGTGQSMEAADVDAVCPFLPAEWLLAGGLTPANVGAAVQRFHPWGVDVASGVERVPGIKDHAKLEAFVNAVRGAESHAG